MENVLLGCDRIVSVHVTICCCLCLVWLRSRFLLDRSKFFFWFFWGGFNKAPRNNLDRHRWYIKMVLGIVLFYNESLEFYPELISLRGSSRMCPILFLVPLLSLWRPGSWVSAHLGHAAFAPQGLHVSCTPEPLGHSIKDHTRRAVYEVRLRSLFNLGVKFEKTKEVFIVVLFFNLIGLSNLLLNKWKHPKRNFIE